MNGKKKGVNLLVTIVLAAAIALPLAMLLTLSPASAIYHPDTNVIDSFLDDTYNRINFNTRQWADLSLVFTNGTEIWAGTNNKYGGTGYMWVWASFDKPQEISKDGVLNTAYCESGPTGARECSYYKQYGDEAELTVEEVDLADLTSRLNEDGIPSALQSGLVGPYVYRLYVCAFDHGYGADMVFHFTTPANYAIGKGWVDVTSDLIRVRVANVLLEEGPDPSTTPSPTPTITPTPTVTPTSTPVITPTPTPINTSTPTPIVSPTSIPTLTPTLTPTPTVTPTPTPKVGGIPQIDIAHSTLLEEPEVGAEAVVTVTIANVGNGVAKNIHLTENIPSSISVSYASGASSFTGNLVLWSGELKPGEVHSITHTVRLLEEKNRFFIAKATFEDEYGKRYETSTTIYVTAKVPTPAPTLPGFEPIFAIVGLLAVAYLLRLKRGKKI
jgi:PGF-CTERM protein